jgi:hypothetical protein
VQHDFAVHSDALLLGGLPNGVPCQVTGLPYPGATSITYDPCVGVTIGGPEVTNPDYCPNNNTVLYSAGDPPSEANLYVNWFIPAITAPPNFTG